MRVFKKRGVERERRERRLGVGTTLKVHALFDKTDMTPRYTRTRNTTAMQRKSGSKKRCSRTHIRANIKTASTGKGTEKQPKAASTAAHVFKTIETNASIPINTEKTKKNAGTKDMDKKINVSAALVYMYAGQEPASRGQAHHREDARAGVGQLEVLVREGAPVD